MKKKAADILEHIRHYCIDVQETLERYGKDTPKRQRRIILRDFVTAYRQS